MERLTKFTNNKTCCVNFLNKECNRLQGNCCNCSTEDRVWDKLRKFEDAEEQGFIFQTADSHLNLNNACTEICFLYKNYGLEKDENLTKDAIELKKRILTVVNTIKNL